MRKRVDAWMVAGGYEDGVAWGGVGFVLTMYVAVGLLAGVGI